MAFVPNFHPSDIVLPDLPIRILAVDDRQDNLIALEAAFNGSGYELIFALSGEEALEKVSEQDFAVILLDVQMPVMDGFETAEQIRKLQRAMHTPIIFVTAINKSEGYERKGYISGAVDFLFKPLDTEILLAKVAVFVDLHKKNHYIKQQLEKSKEQALKAQDYQHLKRSLEARDEFLSIAAHELNTPITPLSLQMQSFIRLMENNAFHEVDQERLKRMLETSFGQVERLSRIIKDLLDVSRFSNGKLQLTKHNTNLAEITKYVLEAFSPEVHKVGCEVKLEIIENPPGEWDRTRIEQVVINLLANALKYGLGNPIVLRIHHQDGFAHLDVIDQGLGIAQEDQERIFERFERAVSPSNYGGMGLGLYISREIARHHQGHLFVESKKHSGSKFTLRLPSSTKSI